MQKLYISLGSALLISVLNYICQPKTSDKSETKSIHSKSIILFFITFIISYILCSLLLEGGVQKKSLYEDDFDVDRMLSHMKLGDAPF